MKTGITSLQTLDAAQTVTASATLVDVTGFTFPVLAAKKYLVKIFLPFTVGATGGFKFRLDLPTVTSYVNAQEVNDGVTASPGAQIVTVITAAADFANAFASVAGNHFLSMTATIEPSAAGNAKLQIACNSAAGAITAIKGGTFTVTQL